MQSVEHVKRLLGLAAGDSQAFRAWEKAVCMAASEYFVLNNAAHDPEEYGYVALRFSDAKGDILILSHYPNLRRLRKLQRNRGVPIERAPEEYLTWLFR